MLPKLGVYGTNDIKSYAAFLQISLFGIHYSFPSFHIIYSAVVFRMRLYLSPLLLDLLIICCLHIGIFMWDYDVIDPSLSDFLMWPIGHLASFYVILIYSIADFQMGAHITRGKWAFPRDMVLELGNLIETHCEFYRKWYI